MLTKTRCLDLLRGEIRRYEAMARLAPTEWQRSDYIELAQALTEAAAALRGRRGSFWSRLATRYALFRED